MASTWKFGKLPSDGALRVLTELSLERPYTIVSSQTRTELTEHGLIRNEPWPGTNGFVSYLTAKGASLAQAMEARRAATTKIGAVHDSAVAESDAPNTSSSQSDGRGL